MREFLSFQGAKQSEKRMWLKRKVKKETGGKEKDLGVCKSGFPAPYLQRNAW